MRRIGTGAARAVLAQMIIALQPEPEETSVAHFTQDGNPSTSIARLWRPGDVPRCRLCERCQLAGHPGSRLCTVVVNRHVPADRAGMFAASDVPAPAIRKVWRPIGPLAHPWWRREA